MYYPDGEYIENFGGYDEAYKLSIPPQPPAHLRVRKFENMYERFLKESNAIRHTRTVGKAEDQDTTES